MRRVTTSRIAGPFWGWLGRAAYELENGEIWKQVHYKYQYFHAQRPRATVWHDGSRYYLDVAGMEDRIEVVRGSRTDMDEDGSRPTD